MDLPVYLRRTANNPALDRVSEGQQQPADDEIVAFLDSNRVPDPNSSSTALLATAPTPTPMQIFPVEEVMKVERPRMQLLIVDDSAPNRSVSFLLAIIFFLLGFLAIINCIVFV